MDVLLYLPPPLISVTSPHYINISLYPSLDISPLTLINSTLPLTSLTLRTSYTLLLPSDSASPTSFPATPHSAFPTLSYSPFTQHHPPIPPILFLLTTHTAAGLTSHLEPLYTTNCSLQRRLHNTQTQSSLSYHHSGSSP
ncbi:hypothetical protein Pmani_032787 [Petrolisthes manimaculis]|uniref:Uncharacterized protein n=1 Tax=Petrolisthes manimaculis TaxID=1843537 RepID=A0AAE1NSF5_9EUCA|nr:hypothetical protein Pmani_032787 [Petrolisthes manimaculis]